MAASMTDIRGTVIAVYPDHASAEDAVRRLQKEGIPMQNLSIIGKDFQAVEGSGGIRRLYRGPVQRLHAKEYGRGGEE